ncbi:MAG: hypothetical protein ACE5FL_08415 [Myxococcota bacterium]
MADATLKPIFSSLEEDPEAGVAIDAFVVGLGERVDMLQDAEVEGDLRQLAALAGGVITEADKAGFAPLSDVAKRLESACFDGDAVMARACLCELTDAAQCVRLGHKGAV